MAFCVNCGTRLADEARFCAGCGAPHGSRAGGRAAPVVVQPLDYTIQGDNLQVARVRLKPGQEIFAEAGKMLYKTANVSWETRMTGDTPGREALGRAEAEADGRIAVHDLLPRRRPGAKSALPAAIPAASRSSTWRPARACMVQRDSFPVRPDFRAAEHRAGEEARAPASSAAKASSWNG